MLVKLAWRNMWRRKRRTLITASTIAFGIFLSVTFTASGDYGYTNMINTSASMGFGHVTVEPEGYNDSPSLDKRISGVDVVAEEAKRLPGVETVAIRIIGQAMFASAVKSVGGLFFGIDPTAESPEINIFIDSIVEGSLFKKTTGHKILVGSKMAEKLNLRLGKKLVYTTTDVNGEIVSEIARVSGIFKTGVDEVDGSTALLPIDALRTTLNYDKDEATIIAVFTGDQRQAGKIRDALEKITSGKNAEVLTWKKTQADMAGLVAIDRAGNYIFQFLVGLMIAAGILNTMLMSVLERTREFGIMIAIGFNPNRLFRLVMVESFFIGLLGIFIGVLIDVPWYIYMSNTGIDLSGLIEGDPSAGGVLIDPVMKFRFYTESVIAIIAGVFSLTMAAGLYPAFKAGRIPPVESIKNI